MLQYLFYVFVLLGSVSWGYFILRLSWPDVRVADSTWKIGSSSMIGFAITIFSTILSFIVGTPFFSTIFFSTALASFLTMRVYSQMRSLKTIKVAIPFSKETEFLPELKLTEEASAYDFGKHFEEPKKRKEKEIEKPKEKPAPPALEEIELRPKVEKPSVIESIFGRKRKEVEIPEVSPEEMPEMEINVPEKAKAAKGEETREVLAKAKEFELDKEVQDIFVDIQEKKAVLPTSVPVTGRRRLWAQPQAASSEEKPSEAQDEIKNIVSDIYVQLKKGGETKSMADVIIPSGAKEEKPAAEAPKEGAKEEAPEVKEEKEAPREEKGILDMLAETKEEKPAAEAPSGEKDVFAELEGLTSEQPKPESKFIELHTKESMACPTCSTKGVKIAFCPYCGTGYCANCSPKVEVKEDAITYTCPKCGETVDVKKK